MTNLNTSTEATITDETAIGFIPCYRQFFIRFKNIPENEISGVYDGDCGKIREELGVSCYQFIKQGENYNIVLSSISTGFLHDLCWLLDDFQDGKISAYLIEAEQVGIGSYGKILDKTDKQFFVKNNNFPKGSWIHKGLVKKIDEPILVEPLKNKGWISPNYVISAFANPISPEKIEKYSDEMSFSVKKQIHYYQTIFNPIYQLMNF